MPQALAIRSWGIGQQAEALTKLYLDHTRVRNEHYFVNNVQFLVKQSLGEWYEIEIE